MPVSTLTWVPGAPTIALPAATNLANRAAYDSYITASMNEPGSFWEIVNKDISTANHNYFLLGRKNGSPGRILIYLKVSGGALVTGQSIYTVPGDTSISLGITTAPSLIYAPHSLSNTPTFTTNTINIGGDETDAVWAGPGGGDVLDGALNLLQNQDSIFLLRGPASTLGNVKWQGVGSILDDGENAYYSAAQSANDQIAPITVFAPPATNSTSNTGVFREAGVLARFGSYASVGGLQILGSWFANNNSQYPLFLPLPIVAPVNPVGNNTVKAFRIRQLALGRSQAADMERIIDSGGNVVAIACSGMTIPKTHLNPTWATNFII